MNDRIEKLQEFLKENPNDSFVMHALGLEYVKMGDDAQAMSFFQEVLKNDPGYVGTYYQLGKLYERASMFQEAAQVYQTGMLTAEGAEDKKSYNELQAAYEELM